jgi:hypothetical protein
VGSAVGREVGKEVGGEVGRAIDGRLARRSTWRLATEFADRVVVARVIEIVSRYNVVGREVGKAVDLAISKEARKRPGDGGHAAVDLAAISLASPSPSVFRESYGLRGQSR